MLQSLNHPPGEASIAGKNSSPFHLHDLELLTLGLQDNINLMHQGYNSRSVCVCVIELVAT